MMEFVTSLDYVAKQRKTTSWEEDKEINLFKQESSESTSEVTKPQKKK